MNQSISKTWAVLLILAIGIVQGVPLYAQSGGSENMQATRKLDQAKQLLSMGEEDRGVKLLSEIPRIHPTSTVRFDAYMELGKHYESKKEYSKAVKQYSQVMESEDDVLVAESLYETGKNYFMMNQYNQAFTYLRKVTTNYPNSVYANQAFYYIGMCHFVQQNWKKAVDNLRMVGTAVSQTDDTNEVARFAEAGQRFFVKIHDKDLVVMAADGKGFQINLTTTRGDEEKLSMEVLDRQGEYYIGSIQTAPGLPVKGDGIVQVAGGDIITTEYIDSNTGDGERMVKKSYPTRIVSTANVAVTDGAYRNLMKGAFLDQTTFLRVIDLDRDTTDKPDHVRVKLTTMYVVKNEDGNVDSDKVRMGVNLDEERIEVRDQLEVDLEETNIDNNDLPAAGHTGVFTAKIQLKEMDAAATPSQDDQYLEAVQGDILRIVYVDDLHIDGTDAVDRTYEAKVLSGGMKEAIALQYILNDNDLKARKNLLEAMALRDLSEIFKNVGLKEKSNSQAKQGLERTEWVILNRKNVAHEHVEQALQTKWELYMVMGDLPAAIATCRELMAFAPDSSLVDQAMIQIGQATAAKGEFMQAIQIYSAVLGIQNSDQKPFAAFSIGKAYEDMAEATNNTAQLTNAMKAYQSCADRYPTSLYAGQALIKVATFYIKMNDYQRAVELMANVNTDFPDLEEMDQMLLMWAIALFRLQRYDESLEKMQQLVDEFPESSSAAAGIKYIPIIRKKIDEAKGKKPADGAAAAKADEEE